MAETLGASDQYMVQHQPEIHIQLSPDELDDLEPSFLKHAEEQRPPQMETQRGGQPSRPILYDFSPEQASKQHHGPQNVLDKSLMDLSYAPSDLSGDPTPFPQRLDRMRQQIGDPLGIIPQLDQQHAREEEEVKRRSSIGHPAYHPEAQPELSFEQSDLNAALKNMYDQPSEKPSEEDTRPNGGRQYREFSPKKYPTPRFGRQQYGSEHSFGEEMSPDRRVDSPFFQTPGRARVMPPSQPPQSKLQISTHYEEEPSPHYEQPSHQHYEPSSQQPASPVVTVRYHSPTRTTQHELYPETGAPPFGAQYDQPQSITVNVSPTYHMSPPRQQPPPPVLHLEGEGRAASPARSLPTSPNVAHASPSRRVSTQRPPLAPMEEINETMADLHYDDKPPVRRAFPQSVPATAAAVQQQRQEDVLRLIEEARASERSVWEERLRHIEATNAERLAMVESHLSQLASSGRPATAHAAPPPPPAVSSGTLSALRQTLKQEKELEILSFKRDIMTQKEKVLEQFREKWRVERDAWDHERLNLRHELETERHRIAALEVSLEEATTQVATKEKAMADLNATVAAKSAELEAMTAKWQAAQQETGAAQVAAENLQHTLTATQQSLDSVQSEMATLRTSREADAREATASREAVDAWKDRAEARAKEVDALTEELRDMHAQLDDVKRQHTDWIRAKEVAWQEELHTVKLKAEETKMALEAEWKEKCDSRIRDVEKLREDVGRQKQEIAKVVRQLLEEAKTKAPRSAKKEPIVYDADAEEALCHLLATHPKAMAVYATVIRKGQQDASKNVDEMRLHHAADLKRLQQQQREELALLHRQAEERVAEVKARCRTAYHKAVAKFREELIKTHGKVLETQTGERKSAMDMTALEAKLRHEHTEELQRLKEHYFDALASMRDQMEASQKANKEHLESVRWEKRQAELEEKLQSVQQLYASQIQQIRQELQTRREEVELPKREEPAYVVEEASRRTSKSIDAQREKGQRKVSREDSVSSKLPRDETASSSTSRLRRSSSSTELYKNTHARVDSGLRRPEGSALTSRRSTVVLEETASKRPSRHPSKGDIKSNSRFVKPLRDDLQRSSSGQRPSWRSQDLIV